MQFRIHPGPLLAFVTTISGIMHTAFVRWTAASPLPDPPRKSSVPFLLVTCPPFSAFTGNLPLRAFSADSDKSRTNKNPHSTFRSLSSISISFVLPVTTKSHFCTLNRCRSPGRCNYNTTTDRNVVSPLMYSFRLFFSHNCLFLWSSFLAFGCHFFFASATQTRKGITTN